jgi:hypothetical protein
MAKSNKCFRCKKVGGYYYHQHWAMNNEGFFPLWFIHTKEKRGCYIGEAIGLDRA